MFDTQAAVVDLTNLCPCEAYTLGVEAGCYMQYSDDELLGQHIIKTRNVMMIEMIAIERGFDLDVFSERGKFSKIRISRRN